MTDRATSDAAISDTAITDTAISETAMSETAITDTAATDRAVGETALRPAPSAGVFAARQACLLGAALVLAAFVTERLRPDEALDRSLTAAPFLWAALAWAGLLLLSARLSADAASFRIEPAALYAGCVAGAIVLVAGLASGGEGGARRIVYILATALGAVMFWSALAGLGLLAARRLQDSVSSARTPQAGPDETETIS